MFRIVAYSPKELQFLAEVRWIDRDSGNIWILSSRFQKFFLKNINPKDTNIRVIRIQPEILQQNINLSHQYNPYYPFDFYNNSVVN